MAVEPLHAVTTFDQRVSSRVPNARRLRRFAAGTTHAARAGQRRTSARRGCTIGGGGGGGGGGRGQSQYWEGRNEKIYRMSM